MVVKNGALPWFTLPETNIAPKNGWVEDEFPFVARPIFRGFVGSEDLSEGGGWVEPNHLKNFVKLDHFKPRFEVK